MSKNYEVLRLAALERELFQTHGSDPRQNENNSRVEDARTREEVFRLVQRVFFANGAASPRLVVFSAAERGNGCTWICAHAAAALAVQAEVPVCLVDANLHAPALHRRFGVDNRLGLTEAVLTTGQIREYIQEIPGKNLWLLTCRPVPADLHGLIGSEKFRIRISELCSDFGYVLIDAPPVNVSAHALILGRLADGLVLVVEANSTRRETARRAKDNLASAGVNLLGAILNKRTYPIPGFLYRRL